MTKKNETTETTIEYNFKDGYKINPESDGKTLTLQWDNIASNNQLTHDYFHVESDGNYILKDDFKDYANIRINFNPELTWARVPYMIFSIRRAFKTIGTYVTKCNKIASGINPESRNKYSTASDNKISSNYAIEKIDDKTVKVFQLDEKTNWFKLTIREIKESGEVEITLNFNGNFQTIGYYVEPFTKIDNYHNRLKQLVQIDADGNQCKKPEYILKLDDNYMITIGDNEPDDLTPYIIQLSESLIKDGFLTRVPELATLKPIKVGGGQYWLNNWMIASGLKTNKTQYNLALRQSDY